MEILRKTMLAIGAILCFGITANAQTPEDIQKAFKASYINEYKTNYSGAIADLQKVYKADSYESNLRLGWLQYLSKQYSSAMDYYQKAIDLKKFSVEARFGYIKPATEAKQYVKVYEKYEEILKIDPFNSSANYWVGISYYGVKKYDVAAKYFELVLNMYPFDYDANHMLAWSYLNQGRPADAKVLFNQALIIKPGDASATEGLAKCK
ncbi:MAG: tetratricopeptide repeat protein [Ferruginibacter sp.]